ncbi:MAG: SDR family oxidoreductase [Propionibacteriaceae bacterium]|jgi:3-oxoacyl-[acyl-carrier protein] reductase|nr:SDR family oxidoreductase [Propionibacteriaceae bacterium]
MDIEAPRDRAASEENNMSEQRDYPDLRGRRVVIPGGTGSVGEGIVRAYLRSGAEVVVPSRSERRAEGFRALLEDEPGRDRLHLVVGDYLTLDGAQRLADRVVESLGEVSDAVATIGGWWAGQPLWAASAQAWETHFVSLATAHLATAQAWLPRIGAEGAYQVIGGLSAVKPVPGSGIVSMQQAALVMQSKVLAAEAGGQRRIFQHLYGPVNNRNRPYADPSWNSADDAGLLCATLSANTWVPSDTFGLSDRTQMAEVMAQISAPARDGETAAATSGDAK